MNKSAESAYVPFRKWLYEGTNIDSTKQIHARYHVTVVPLNVTTSNNLLNNAIQKDGARPNIDIDIEKSISQTK